MSKKTKQRQAAQHGIIWNTAEATGVLRRAVDRVIHELKENAGASFTSPKKRYDTTRQRITADDFDRDTIRCKIHSMYEEKRHLTLTIMLYELKRAGLFQGERTVLHSVLREMGFKYKRMNNKCHYFEQPRIIEQRH